MKAILYSLGGLAAILTAARKKKGSPATNAWEELAERYIYSDPEIGEEEFREFYPQSAQGRVQIYPGEKLYPVSKVSWPGNEGHLVPVRPRYVEPVLGNIFDGDKLYAVAQQIQHRSRNNPVILRPGYAIFSIVDRGDISDSLKAEQRGYDDEWGQPYTTGHPHLDEYLMELDDDYGASPRATDIGDLIEAMLNGAYEKELERAEKKGDGDFGSLTAQVRDGNHRTFGAIIGGEPYVLLRVSDHNMTHFRDYPTADTKKLLAAIHKAQKREGLPLLSLER